MGMFGFMVYVGLFEVVVMQLGDIVFVLVVVGVVGLFVG